MPNGNITEYTKREKGSNRLLLVSDVDEVMTQTFDPVIGSSRNPPAVWATYIPWILYMAILIQ